MMALPQSSTNMKPESETMKYRRVSSCSKRLGVLSWALSLPWKMAGAERFDPYQLNGGLVSAVAAKDFVVIASDTRFMGEGGYDIVSRDHIESRLWMAGDNSHNLQNSMADDDEFFKGQRYASLRPMQAFVLPQSPTFVGTAGCNADCEALKRIVQADLRSAVYFGECTAHPHPPVDQVATLLSQILYSRRTFPFYSFCVVGGLADSDSDDEDSAGGHVYVYDAIGSYERVAVASSGTGRELLQPILDRKFRTIAPRKVSPMMTSTTVPAQVDCTAEEAVSIIIDAYRSVSEREIGVGDNLIICVVEKEPKSDSVQCKVYKLPLKKH
jgi:20S proteasome subunit beta 6